MLDQVRRPASSDPSVLTISVMASEPLEIPVRGDCACHDSSSQVKAILGSAAAQQLEDQLSSLAAK
jgi:hypothetical protein